MAIPGILEGLFIIELAAEVATMRVLPRCSCLALAIALTACVPFAFPVGVGEPEPFSSGNLSFIEAGRTTKAQLREVMPGPLMSRDGDTWLYAVSREEDNWVVGVIAVDGTGGSHKTGAFDYRYLLVRFDENDVITGYETSRSEGEPGCNRPGICALGPVYACHGRGTCVTREYYTVFASETEDRAAKRFEAPATGCAAYVYGEPGALTYIRLDKQLSGALLGGEGFMRERLAAGVHELEFSASESLADRSVEFRCSTGELLFFEVRTTRPGVLVGKYVIEVSKRDASVAHEAIADRRLSLLLY